jgi:cysteine desulfurase
MGHCHFLGDHSLSIYLDHNATTPLLPEVASAMDECYRRAFANPSSQHAAGRRAREVIEDGREYMAQLLGASQAGRDGDRLIFTSGGTESNNLAIRGLAGSTPGRIVISAIEHPSVIGPAEFLAGRGWEVIRLGADSQGIVRLDELASILDDSKPIQLVSIMRGNNETGALQPITRIANLCIERSVPLHSDAVQVVGKLPVNFQKLGVTTLSFAAHKFHGPRGIGGLLVRGDVPPSALRPLLYGGVQEGGMRPGTEPVALVAGMRCALELYAREADARERRLAALRERFETRLYTAAPNVVVNSAGADRLPHTSNVSFPGLDRRALVMALDLDGVACSTGSACASGSSEPSPVLIAMGLSDELVSSSVRFSFGATTTESEIDDAVSIVARVLSRMRGRGR